MKRKLNESSEKDNEKYNEKEIDDLYKLSLKPVDQVDLEKKNSLKIVYNYNHDDDIITTRIDSPRSHTNKNENENENNNENEIENEIEKNEKINQNRRKIIGFKKQRRFQVHLPEFLSSDLWFRHNYSIEDIVLTISKFDLKWLWMLVYVYGVEVPAHHIIDSNTVAKKFALDLFCKRFKFLNPDCDSHSPCTTTPLSLIVKKPISSKKLKLDQVESLNSISNNNSSFTSSSISNNNSSSNSSSNVASNTKNNSNTNLKNKTMKKEVKNESKKKKNLIFNNSPSDESYGYYNFEGGVNNNNSLFKFFLKDETINRPIHRVFNKEIFQDMIKVSKQEFPNRIDGLYIWRNIIVTPLCHFNENIILLNRVIPWSTFVQIHGIPQKPLDAPIILNYSSLNSLDLVKHHEKWVLTDESFFLTF